jgi:hypothetical protein
LLTCDVWGTQRPYPVATRESFHLIPGRASVRPRTARTIGYAGLLALLLIAASSVAAYPQAHADGDPASDVLLAQDVFYPYQPKVTPHVEAAMEKTLRAAASADGPHLKVAIIGAPE